MFSSNSNNIIKLDITPLIYNKMTDLENHYKKFWKKIFKSDAYIYYKNALLFYKNTQDDKFHSFYSGMINKRLYTGNCIVANKKMLKTFNNNDNNNITTSDDLCELTVITINLMDKLFEIAPRLNNNTVVYRNIYNIDKNNSIVNLKVGDYYRSLEYYSCSLSPFLHTNINDIYYDDLYKLKYENNKYDIYDIFITIMVPKGSKSIYINFPFYLNNNDPYNEFELLLPRDCIYYIKKRKVIGSIILYTFQIIEQLKASKRKITRNSNNYLPSTNINNEYKKKLNIFKKNIIDYDKILINYKTNFYNNILKNFSRIKTINYNNKKILKYKGKIIGICNNDININILYKKKINNEINLKNFYIQFYDKNIEYIDYFDYFFLRGLFTFIKDNNLGYNIIDTKKPVLIIFDININNEIEINKTQSLNFYILNNNIKLKIVNINKIIIINDFFYLIIKCDQLK